MGVITIPPIDRSSDLVPRRSGNRGDILIAQGIQPPVFTSPDKVVTPVVEGIVEPIINEVVSETVPAMIDGAIEEQVPPIVNEAIGEQVPTMIENSIEEQVPPMIDERLIRVAGFIQAYGGSTDSIPAGWIPCDGAILNTTDYPELYLAIGRIYTDSGVSPSIFSVPDLGGRMAVGANASNLVGSKGGSDTITVNQMPSHTHALARSSNAGGLYGQIPPDNGVLVGTDPRAIGNSGGGQPHRHPYTVVNYIISTGSAMDATGSLVTAGIANGAVTQEKLAPELQGFLTPFVYTTEKKARGRTDDDYIIWGQKFLGTVTATAGQVNEQTLISGLPQEGRLINAFGSFTWSGTVLGVNASLIGGANTSGNYSAWVIRRATGTIAVETVANNARTNSPYEVFVDWIDGTKWYE